VVTTFELVGQLFDSSFFVEVLTWVVYPVERVLAESGVVWVVA
jgi:hypothetical protein